jgi:hypothetical protein
MNNAKYSVVDSMSLKNQFVNETNCSAPCVAH